jgi:hypothetical protein
MTMSALWPLFLVLPWLLFLPGYLTHLCFAVRQPRPAERDGLEIAFISLLYSLCLTGWLALILIELGSFSLPLLLGPVLLYCLALIWRLKGRGAPWRSLWSTDGRWTWLLLGLLLLAALLYLQPHEYVLGGADAGVYVNLGAHISRSGSLVYNDPELADLDPALYPALFRQQNPDQLTRYIQFPGFYISDEQPGQIIPQFYPLQPAWMAIFYSLGGARASLYATPLWGVLACLAVALAARTLFGKHTGILAAAFLTINATQIWFSRYPTSETLTQLLLFGGIYAFARYTREHAPEMGLLAGLALGQVMLVRLDTYPLLAIPVLWLAYLRLTRQLERRHLVFLLPFMALGLHSLAHGYLQSWPYLHNTYSYLFALIPLPVLLLAAGLACAAFFPLDWWTGRRTERLAWLARWTQRGATILAILVVLAAFYGYFIRPQRADPSLSYLHWYSDQNVPYVEPYNLQRLGWYISPLGIALAVLGAWYILRHKLSPHSALFVGVSLFFSFFYLYNSRNNPFHIYVMRRYVPAVIPAFSIAAAYALAHWWQRRPGRWRWLACVAATAQLALLLYAGRFVVRQVDHRGLLDQFTRWAESLPPDAVIIFDDERPVSTGATIGTPLHYLFGHTVLDLQEEHLTERTLDDLLHAWLAQDRPVILAVGDRGARQPFANWPLTPLPGLRLESRVLESSYYHFPRQVQSSVLRLELYQLLPASSRAATTLQIDVGSSDFFYLGEGWHGKEQLAGGLTMRWTSGAAQFDLPLLGDDDELYLRFELAASASPGHTPTEVRLRTGETIVARWQVGVTFEEYEATLPLAALQGDSVALWLETDAWIPAALGINADSRELGVMVDWISVE